MNFGEAIEALKQGKKVTRKGWNGKGMFLWLKPATVICMFTHDSTGRKAILTGWLASQSDMLSEDWNLVD